MGFLKAYIKQIIWQRQFLNDKSKHEQAGAGDNYAKE